LAAAPVVLLILLPAIFVQKVALRLEASVTARCATTTTTAFERGPAFFVFRPLRRSLQLLFDRLS
jgi:hypothetical protein